MQADRRAIPTLLVVLTLAVGAAATLTQLGALRRTAEAPVTITSAISQPGGGTKDRERGHHLEYLYDVGSIPHPGIAFRTWTSVDAQRPKVCYDPANPRDHLLVAGDVPCGIGAMFR